MLLKVEDRCSQAGKRAQTEGDGGAPDPGRIPFKDIGPDPVFFRKQLNQTPVHGKQRADLPDVGEDYIKGM